MLGPRLSEEPYSTRDKRLLASVASQAGVAMRSISLAEKMAERMEAERRAEQEMQIARQVQSRLLPQQAPVLKTLDCAGKCIQTRAVGGDYYDFLDFGAGKLGMVLADISGKGMSSGAVDGKPAGQFAWSVRSGDRGFAAAAAFGELPVLQEHRDQQLRHHVFLHLRRSDTAHFITSIADTTLRSCCARRHGGAAGGDGDRSGLVRAVGLHGGGERQLAPGDALVIYTDGISEAAEGEGERGVRRGPPDRGRARQTSSSLPR